MNNKESKIYEILDIVVSACRITEEENGVTAENVLSKCKKENVVMTRAIFVTQLMFLGYSSTTIATILHITEQGVSNILNKAHEFRRISWAYRVAEAEATLKVRKLAGL